MGKFVWIGLAIWAAATGLLRLAGGHWLSGEDPARLSVLFAATAVAIALPVAGLARGLPTREGALRAVVVVVLPGILLDAESVLWFRRVFPNLPESAGRPFASLLLWAYGVALLTGLLASRARRYPGPA